MPRLDRRRPSPARSAIALAAGLLLLALPAGAEPYRIGSRDLLQVSVYQQQDLSAEVRVGEDGTVNLPLIGTVAAAGKTVEELGRDLDARYREFLHTPQANVFIKEFAKREVEVSMLGEVARPGLYRFPEHASLLEAISQVGGLTQESGERVIVLRPVTVGERTETEAIILNAETLFTPEGMQTHNIELRDGDAVNVPRADHYYVFGEVARPGTYKLEKGAPLTVFKAVGLAGGFTDKAARKNIKITRGEGENKSVIKANLETPVQAMDIIIVPESFF